MQPTTLLYSALLTSFAYSSLAYTFRDNKRKQSSLRNQPVLSHLYKQAPIADINPPEPESTPNPSTENLKAARREQSPVMSIIPPVNVPDSSNQPDNGGNSNSPNTIMISDVIGKTRSINIFAGFTRDINTVSSRLDDQSMNTTVLAPLNSAIQALPRKPWESPADYERLGSNAYAGDEGEDRAHANLRHFVEAHCVVLEGRTWGEGQKVKSLGGQDVWWEMKGEKKVVQPGEVEVEGVADTVANGEVWVLKGVVNYSG